jgi:hypothetical protein
MQIQVISCSKPEWKEKPPKSKWQEVNLTFAAAGKTQVKKFLSFNPIFNKIKEMVEGEQYEVAMQKNDAGYWDWTSVEKSISADSPPFSPDAPKQMSRPSTYETAEERAKKQVYIIRQSSLANAISLLAANGGKKNTVEEVMIVANQFADFVLGENVEAPSIFDMEDDLPN